ncbi:MAG TPA: hypothetical protein EYG50_01260 [Cycloclasticus sp.]|jgi:hypothetical protein|nr:hypothetical protein [Cycloclasticus sp.]
MKKQQSLQPSNLMCISLIFQNGALAKSLTAPYLVSGVNVLDDTPVPSQALEQSVGYINGKPSVADICVNIRLGLLWYKEREQFSRCGQDVLKCLKSSSRNKQRRIVDVSCEMIKSIYKSQNVSLASIAELKGWLASTIAQRS